MHLVSKHRTNVTQKTASIEMDTELESYGNKILGGIARENIQPFSLRVESTSKQKES